MLMTNLTRKYAVFSSGMRLQKLSLQSASGRARSVNRWAKTTLCGQLHHLIQCQLFNHNRPLLLIADDIQKRKSYTNQKFIV